MDVDTWRQKVAADRPPLSRAQLAVLRPIWANVTPRMRSAAPAETGTAPGPVSAPQQTQGEHSQ